MQIGIFAKTFPGADANAVLAQVAAAGFTCTQFNMACAGLPSLPESISAATVSSIAAASQRHNVAISAVSATYNMIHPDVGVRARGLASLAAIIAAASDIGSRLVTLCTGTRDAQDQWRHHPDNTTPQAWRDLLAEMSRAIEIAERHGVDLGIEPELANVICGAAEARRLIDQLGSPRLRIVLDPANLFEVAAPEQRRALVAHAAQLLGDRISMAHAKDRAPDGGFATAGKGVVDFAHFADCLRAAGFDGPLVAHGLTAEEAAGVAAFLRQTLHG